MKFKRILNGIYLRILTKYFFFYRMYLELNYYKKKEWLVKRKGYCKKCASCCENCILLDTKTKLCKNRELSEQFGCALFPLHPLQLKIFRLEGKCGYYWEKK